MAVIVVITDELARFSDPSAGLLVRDDLVAAIAQFADQQLTDPAVAVSANLHPASITNGVAPVVAASGSVADINAALTTMIGQLAAANMPFTSPRWLMNPTTRIALGNMRTVQEVYAFPEMQMGNLKDYTVIESNSIPVSTVILVECSQVPYASDPVVDIEASQEASLQLDSAPATPPNPVVSLWQQNMLGIRAEQYQYWTKRDDGCVAVGTGITPAGFAVPEPQPEQHRERGHSRAHVPCGSKRGGRSPLRSGIGRSLAAGVTSGRKLLSILGFLLRFHRNRNNLAWWQMTDTFNTPRSRGDAEAPHTSPVTPAEDAQHRSQQDLVGSGLGRRGHRAGGPADSQPDRHRRRSVHPRPRSRRQ
jgi:hypothetical protein